GSVRFGKVRYSKGLKLPTDMEPLTNPVADPLGIDAKYQADQTQSAGLRYQSMIENEGKTSSKASDNEEVFAARKEMNEDIPPTDKEAQITEDQWVHHEEATVSYADLKAFIEGYYKENFDHRDQTDKLESIKDDPALKKVIKATEAYTKNSTSLHELLTLIKNFNLQGLKSLVATAMSQDQHLAAWANSSTFMAWNLGPRLTAIEISQTKIRSKISSFKSDTSEIKSMMTEIYQAFKGKGIVTNDQLESTTKKLMPASKVIREDPNEPIMVPYMINGKMQYLSNDEINDHIEKEDKIKKAVEEAKMLKKTKTKVIKVVQ
nr:hypothetical protein [Tanacetum cinerariifolium]